MWLIDRWWGDRAPSGADGLAFRHCTVKDDILLSWSHRRCGRGCLWKTFDFWERNLECNDLDLNVSNGL